MKKTKIKELAQNSADVLRKMMTQVGSDIQRIRLEKNAGRLKDLTLLGKKRQEKARILTFIREKELKSV